MDFTRFDRHIIMSQLERRKLHEGYQIYTAEFKAEAIKQITERGHSAIDVAQRLGISIKSLCKWTQEACNGLIKCNTS